MGSITSLSTNIVKLSFGGGERRPSLSYCTTLDDLYTTSVAPSEPGYLHWACHSVAAVFPAGFASL